MKKKLFYSKIALGSAQWGLPYGISNKQGITKKDELKKILNIAYNSRISLIDTALAYGDAEKNLGELNLKNFKIITKIKKFDNKSITKSNQIDLENQLKISLENLKLEKIHGLLFHSGEDLLKDNGNLLIEKMIEFKEKGLVEKIGFSIYQSSNLNMILKNFKPDIIQLPINIFDQKLYLDGTLKCLKEDQIEIHARSIFLQGLLLMDNENIPPYFEPWRNNIKKFHQFCLNNNMSKLEAALNFIFQIKYIDKFIIGFNDSSQLKECLEINEMQKKINFKNLSVNDLNFINPMNWKL